MDAGPYYFLPKLDACWMLPMPSSAPHINLLNFCFLEFHVLADDGIVFLDHHFFRLGTGIFFRHIVVARVGAADQSDFNG
jgi:hypothetical protein